MPRRPHFLDASVRSFFLGLVNHLRNQHLVPKYEFGETIDGLRLTMNIRSLPAVADDSFDLPEAIRRERPSVRRTYRALRDIRGEVGTVVGVWPAQIRDRIASEDNYPDTSIDTTNHALGDLRELGIARRTDDRGYLLGAEQPTLLPISNRQAEPPPAEVIVAYASGMRDHFGIRKPTIGRAIMSKKRIWVPVEKTEYGILATDAETEELIPVTEEKVEKMSVPTKGRTRTSDAARGELIEVDGRCAVVKLSGRTVRVRVLGDWHLKGLQSPEPATVA